MVRTFFFIALVAIHAACAGVLQSPDPRGSVKSDQRMIVMVYQSPGPWIVADPDSKTETAIKLMPLGAFLQGMQEDRINDFSKEIQPYLPRLRYGQAVEAAMIQALKAAHGGPVQTSAEAGIAPLQRRDWNASVDQLDWRRKYYFTETGKASPRDYSKLLSLDDAIILEINLSFGLEPAPEDRTLPTLSAAARAYRADTTRMLWSREVRLSDTISSSTLSEFRAAPGELTDRLYALSAPLAVKITAAFMQDAGLTAAPSIPVALPLQASATTYLSGAPVQLSTTPMVSIDLSSTNVSGLKP